MYRPPRRLAPRLAAAALVVVAALWPGLTRTALGQERTAPDRTVEAVRATEREQEAAARDWAAGRGLPLRVAEPDGGVVELVGVTGGRPRYLTTLNRAAAAVTHTDRLYPGQPLGLSLTGRGFRLGVWDAGHALASHQEFAGRLTFGDQAASDHHATHVAGTLGAAGVNPEARGMAFEAQLVSYTWHNDTGELAVAARDGLLVSNHSYGAVAGWHYGDLEDRGQNAWYWLGDPAVSEVEDYSFGWYDLEALQFDRTLASNPYTLAFVAAGNDRDERGPAGGTYRGLDANARYQTYDVAARPRPPDGFFEGYDTIAGAGVAKNVVTVGSIRIESGGAVTPSAFSSFGPTDDGRVKPDLVGFGENVFSTAADGPAGYDWLSGTSMATPNVAGTALLLQQHYQTLTGGPLRAASLKGLLLHTARDLEAPGPDYRTGWGLVDAEAAALHLSEALSNPLALVEGTLVRGETFTRVATRTGASPLRVTLSWTDPQSRVLSASGPSALDNPYRHLVNDLDLRVIEDETGTVYFPFRLDPAEPSAAATTGDNDLDPVEQVFVPDARGGTYTITVTHKDSLRGNAPQPFTLLVSGASAEAVPVAVTHLQADAGADVVSLAWQTHFERSAGRFVVERAPLTITPGQEKQVGAFAPVGEVVSAGPSDAIRHYTFEDTRFPAGRYVYRILFDDGSTWHTGARVEVNVVPPTRPAVLSSYPNPFQGQTTVVLDVPKSSDVRVEVYDGLGRRIAALFEGTLPAGRHHVPLTAADWAPGLYHLRAVVQGAVLHHAVILLP